MRIAAIWHRRLGHAFSIDDLIPRVHEMVCIRGSGSDSLNLSDSLGFLPDRAI